MSTWWQVYVNGKVFGFKTSDCPSGLWISEHPEYSWKNRLLSEYKPWLRENKAEVVKIASINN